MAAGNPGVDMRSILRVSPVLLTTITLVLKEMVGGAIGNQERIVI